MEMYECQNCGAEVSRDEFETHSCDGGAESEDSQETGGMATRSDSAPPTMGVFGAQQQGKSVFLQANVIERGATRRIIVDPVGSLPSDLRIMDNPDALWKYLEAVDKRDKEAGHYDSPFAVSYMPRSADAKGIAERLAEWSAYLSSVLIVDEAHAVCPPTEVKSFLIDLGKRGRHYGCAVWAASQRPADVSRHLTAGSERVFFWCDEARDMDYIRHSIGGGAREIVRGLEPLHYLYRYGRTAYLGNVGFVGGNPRCYKIRDVTQEELD